MRLVLAALQRPVTVVVALIAIALCAWLAVERMPVDIFPQVGDPAIYVAQPYSGMDPAQMEGYLTYYYEYHFLYITGIDHVESKSIQGATLMKLVFHEGTNMSQAMSETVGYVNRARSFNMPSGTGAAVHHAQVDDPSACVAGRAELIFSSATHTQGELQDYAINRVRPLFATLPGVSAPPPFGGNQRTIVVTLDPDKLRQYQVSPDEAIAAVSKSTLVMPSGNMWTGKVERIARTNAALGGNLSDLLGTPIRPVSGATVYLRDIGTIENGTDIVSAYAHVDGKRTVYIPVTKRADASTLAVVDAVKAAIPTFKKALPEDVAVSLQFDQSPYVTNSLRGLVLEGLLGAALTGLMVLIFLRDWRSALIVVLNIPFALLSAVVLLWVTGQTINIMTLGGLALAVGVLVDEATVEIENIHTRMLPGVSRARAVVEACSTGPGGRLRQLLRPYVLHPRGVRSVFLHGGGEPAVVRAAFHGGGIFHDRVLPALQQPGSGTFHVAHANGAPRRRERGLLRLPARAIWPLPGRRPAVSVASRAALSGRLCWIVVYSAAATGDGTVSGRQLPAAAHPPARSGGYAHRGDGADRAARPST